MERLLSHSWTCWWIMMSTQTSVAWISGHPGPTDLQLPATLERTFWHMTMEVSAVSLRHILPCSLFKSTVQEKLVKPDQILSGDCQQSNQQTSTTHVNTWCQGLLVINSSDAWYVPLVPNCIFHFIDLNFLLLLLEHAILFQFKVDSFTLHDKDLWPLFISKDEWEVIKLVCGRLLNFCEATKQMSTSGKR